MANKKGSHWKKPKVLKRKINTTILNETYSKIETLCKINKKLNTLKLKTVSSIVSMIIEKNIGKYIKS